MALTDARVTVNLPEHVYGPLSELAEALGMSRSALLRELAESAVPVWEVVLDAARVTKGQSERQREVMAELARSLAPAEPVDRPDFGEDRVLFGLTMPSVARLFQ